MKRPTVAISCRLKRFSTNVLTVIAFIIKDQAFVWLIQCMFREQLPSANWRLPDIRQQACTKIPRGFFTCLPRGCGPSSVGIPNADKQFACCDPFFTADVISIVKGSKPFLHVFLHSFRLHKHQLSNQLRLKKCNNTFLPFVFEAILNDLLYHNILSFFLTVLPTPDKADSIAKGTKIFPWNADACFSYISRTFLRKYCQHIAKDRSRFCQSFLFN